MCVELREQGLHVLRRLALLRRRCKKIVRFFGGARFPVLRFAGLDSFIVCRQGANDAVSSTSLGGYSGEDDLSAFT